MARGRGGRRGPGPAQRNLPRPDDSNSTNRRNSANRPRLVCQYFLAGRCTYGLSCRFSHDEQDMADVNEATSAGATEAEVLQSDREVRQNYINLRRQLRRFGAHSVSLRQADCLAMWTLAANVMDGHNKELQQSVARDLADGDMGGPALIGQTVQLCSDLNPSECIVNISRHFLRTITHPSLLRCLSIDSFVGTIYRMVGGSNGDQGIEFFGALNLNLTKDSESPETCLALVVSCLYELLRRKRKCLLHDNLPELLMALNTKTTQLAALVGDAASSSPKLDVALVRIDMMRRMADGALGRLSGNPPAETTQSATRNRGTTHVRSTFPMEATIPGGKHDNDFADITKIQIFPTIGEITSDGPEYLPMADLTQSHFLADPVRRHLDCAFRLLRHDVFGTLKEVIGTLMAQPDIANAASASRFIHGNIKGHSYGNASIQHVLIDGGLRAFLSFAQPPQLRKYSSLDRRAWWQHSSRLEPGSLVCYVSTHGEEKSFLLFVVTKKSTKEVQEDQHESTLVSEHLNPAVTARLASETQANMATLHRLYVRKQQGLLIELPGLIPETFVPILENLQQMMRDGNLAFQRWILPPSDPRIDEAPTNISPPAYARQLGFKFRLDSITLDGHDALRVDPSNPTDGVNPETLESATGLDRGQSESLIAALTREYALIQGPPGTGKSYVGVQLVRVLLDHKLEADLGPILIICYTNHALDQFLSHLLEVGIDKIIRIGGQSRAAELEGKNLRVVSRGVAKTTVENGILGRNYAGIEECLEEAGMHLNPLHIARKNKLNWNLLEDFLIRHHPDIAKQFRTEDGDGFTMVGGDPLQVWLGKGQGPRNWRTQQGGEQVDITEVARRAVQDIQSLAHHERRLIVESWVAELTEVQSDWVFELVDEAASHREELKGVHDDVSRRTLLQADVVGVTTTGLARNIKMLRNLGIKVVICEEAAEVMEPHLISALMPGVEHFIQIGDHRQLRPQIQNYLQFSLETPTGRAYQLDRSQFERRAVGEPGLPALPVAQLNVQRRMRPEISQLIRSVYPNLQDHDCVKDLPSVVGMRRNLFWLDHDHPEDSKDDGNQVMSHSNAWEVMLAAALIRHLVRQGEYTSTDIALLTPYTGQLQKLRAALSKDFEVFLSDRDLETLAKEGFEDKSGEEQEKPVVGPRKAVEKKQLLQTIRLATVDNFQGEEAKVIVVSLVRSNSNCKVGFLRTENRINVLLSRAQHGMYLIGNTNTYRNVPMWADVHRQLSERESVGTSIELCCPRHPDTPILCSEPSDFVTKSPEGGCSLICDKRLEPCGHKCPAPCHSQRLHDAFDCLQPCPRLRSTCAHTCPKLCGQECGPCKVVVNGVKLPCGHVHDGVACYKTLDLASIRCSRQVEKMMPGCGHTVTVACCEDVTSKFFRCPTKCVDLLPCGHQCPGACGRCRIQGEDGAVSFRHQRCNKPCDRLYGTCNHRCSKPCHEGQECGVCPKTCEVRCPHSRCQQECQKPCAPCIEPCTWSCEHKGSCSLPCAAPCNRLPCDERCTKLLKCGHQCPSFCGEECPQDLCQLCCTEKDARVDLMEFKIYGEIDLNETPIAVLSCGHFFTGETLDGLVGMSNAYTTDKFGAYNGLSELSGEFMAVPTCPDCRIPIRQFATRRYNRVVNKAVLDETSKRFLVDGRERLHELEGKVTGWEGELEGLSALVGSKSATEHHEIGTKLDKEAAKLRREMNAEYQPTKKLFDAVLAFQRRNSEQASLEQKMGHLNVSQSPGHPAIPQPVYDRQITLGAHRLQLRVQEAMLRSTFAQLSRHKNEVLTAIPGGPPDKGSARFLHQCQDLIAKATKANLPRLIIPTCLGFARITQLRGWYLRSVANTTFALVAGSKQGKEQEVQADNTETARQLLADALALCDSFPGGAAYRDEVQQTMKLFEGPRYETVTPEEIAAIKTAMVSGPGGIATHSGHWYHCRNGHPFAIGECGMPMEQARCPECGETIGGQNHTATEGTVRDMRMETA